MDKHLPDSIAFLIVFVCVPTVSISHEEKKNHDFNVYDLFVISTLQFFFCNFFLSAGICEVIMTICQSVHEQ
jgi:branched-subunit amino acid transport protein AzlD